VAISAPLNVPNVNEQVGLGPVVRGHHHLVQNGLEVAPAGSPADSDSIVGQPTRLPISQTSVHGGFQGLLARDISFRATLAPVSIRNAAGEHLTEPGGQLSLAFAVELAALPMGFQERLLHDVRHIELAPGADRPNANEQEGADTGGIAPSLEPRLLLPGP
jgi:hypothetical protein